MIRVTAHPEYLSPEQLAYADGRPQGQGAIRTRPEDFQVDEELGFELEGCGQHLWLRIEKRLRSTDEVASLVADAAGIARHRVSFAGLKDRQAVTRQWFSVDLAGLPAPDWASQLPADCRVLSETYHRRKLRRGGLKRNRFVLEVRSFVGEPSEVDSRLARIGRAGVPNYFGPQRFGINAGNVNRAWAMLTRGERVRDRFRRSLYLSTARSLLFNRVLSHRVHSSNWHRPVDGDVMMLDGSSSVFVAAEVDERLRERACELDVHPTGPLWGEGPTQTEGAARRLESDALAGCESWCAGLVAAGLSQARRALRLRVSDLQWDWPDKQRLSIAFSLPAGGYATSVLREIIMI